MSDLMPSPSDFVGAYRIVRPIGKGGMGMVFEAEHTRTGQPAAIKVLHARFTEDTEALSRFLAEGRATAKLDHPSIVRILETGQLPSGACYIAMEYLRGETLGVRLKRQGRLGQDALRIGAQIAAALVQAHQKNIIHRDLKPSNLIICAKGEGESEDVAGEVKEQVKIIDFGIAKIAGDDKETGEFRTRTGTMIGTPVYMSPEQCRGVAVTDRTDVYALGIILYQALAGKPPFYSRADGDILAMHIMVAPRPLRQLEPAVPQSVADFIGRMLAKSAPERPNMATVATELLQLLEDPEWQDPAPPPLPTTPVPIAPPPAETAAVDEDDSHHEPQPAVLPPVATPVAGSVVPSGAAVTPAAGSHVPAGVAVTPAAGSHVPAGAAVTPAAGSHVPARAASASIGPVGGSSPVLTSPVQPVRPRRFWLGSAAGLGVALLAAALVFRSVAKPVTPKVYGVDAGSAATYPVPTVPTGIQVTPLPPNTLTASSPVVTPESATVRWSVRSQPTGATVLSESGESLGQTPLVHTTARSIGTQTIILRLPGYRDAQLSLSLGSDEEREAELVASAPLKPGPKGGKYPSRHGGKQRSGQGKRTADDTTILLDFKTKKVLKTQ